MGLDSTNINRLSKEIKMFNFQKILQNMYISSLSHAQSHWTLLDPTDCSPPGSSVRGTSQSRILELVAISSFIGSSQPRNRTLASFPALAGRFFTTEPLGKPLPHFHSFLLLLGAESFNHIY